MSPSLLDLRAVVADVVREVVAELAADRASADTSRPPAPAGEAPARIATGVEHISPPRLRERVEAVRIADDTDLARFARHLLALLENPKNRQDLRAGRLRFQLEGGNVTVPADRPAQRIETGAVTERRVTAAAEAGHRLVLARRAVLTPLAREKARALGVPIEKER